MELCEKGNLLEVLREPENNLGLSEEAFLRFFGHLGNLKYYFLFLDMKKLFLCPK